MTWRAAAIVGLLATGQAIAAQPKWVTDGNVVHQEGTGEQYIFAVDTGSIDIRRDAIYLTARADYAKQVIYYLAAINRWSPANPPTQETVTAALEQYYVGATPLAAVIYELRVDCAGGRVERLASTSYAVGKQPERSTKKSGYVHSKPGGIGFFVVDKVCAPLRKKMSEVLADKPVKPGAGGR